MARAGDSPLNSIIFRQIANLRGALNVLIGPNGSGKSNLIEAIALLQAAPTDLSPTIGFGGGIRNWQWRGEQSIYSSELKIAVENPLPFGNGQRLLYLLSFAEKFGRFHLVEEVLKDESTPTSQNSHPYCTVVEGRAKLRYWDGVPSEPRRLISDELEPQKSILSQRKDIRHYPEITFLGQQLARIRFYREWSFGRHAPPRLPQNADLPNDFLAEDARNLGLILSKILQEPKLKKLVLSTLRELYDGVDDFGVIIEGGTVQVFLQEGNISVPATRLSDGTLRYLCLLAILCQPDPPPLVCLEEPELGLHPDILPGLARLLVDASKRFQLIVTTHSDVLVDALSDQPENVLVCEKREGQTRMRRLSREELAPWLERYRLGELWNSGSLGGNRW